jgi:sulfide dehydrogenase [flavocytochrome c] flavoprotein subunit
MTNISRRDFVKASGVAIGLSAFGMPALLSAAKDKGRVVVIGGGYGGAIVAKYIRLADPQIKVTLIEKKPEYVSCPLSNEVLGGERQIESLTFGYRGLTGHGVAVIQDEIVEIDAAKHVVVGKGGHRYRYDRLVVSPGIDFRWNAIAGYDEAASEIMPHAWKAGPQTLNLRKQLEAMDDGGVFYIVAPPNPFRCPPGPYERAAQVAHYFKHHKPKSKVIILDRKDRFSKQGLFTAGWKQEYGDMIEWVSGAAGGIVEQVDPKTRTLIGLVDEFQADVANVIPPQQAGAIARSAGLADESGWCPVDQRTFESTIHKDVHVIGDASIAGKMPKSGYAANSQGKVCAAAVVAMLNGEDPPAPSYVNTCYSLIAPDYGISVAAVYELVDGEIVPIEGAGGLSPADASARVRALEAEYAKGWFKNITADMFT